MEKLEGSEKLLSQTIPYFWRANFVRIESTPNIYIFLKSMYIILNNCSLYNFCLESLENFFHICLMLTILIVDKEC